MKELKDWLAENPINAAKVAEYIGVSRSNFSNKVNQVGRNKFTKAQIEKLRVLLKKIKENSDELDKFLEKHQ